jgi:hypothetical protein
MTSYAHQRGGGRFRPYLTDLLDMMKRLDIQALIGPAHDSGFFTGFAALGQDHAPDDTIVSRKDVERTVARLALLEAHCVDLGLTASAVSVRRLIDAERLPTMTFGRLRELSNELAGRLQDELQSSLLLSIDPAKAHFFTRPHLFGEAVAQRFPSAITDIEEAGKCLALERSTACVFHLMRVAEIGLQAFGTKMGLTLTDMKNWRKILSDVQGAINRLPRSTREEKDYVGQCQAVHAHLQAVKDAWRNDVMHPLASHTPEQATDIWTHTGALMRKLAGFV